MPHKHLLVQSAAREKILRGAMALVDAMRPTLGPKSKCVLIEKKWGRPLVCNDGVTIAKEFELEDHEENLGAQVIRQAAERTGDAVGDGTTTATLLAHGDLRRRSPQYRGWCQRDRTQARASIAACAAVVAHSSDCLGRSADHKQQAQVATISAHNDSDHRRTGRRRPGESRRRRHDVGRRGQGHRDAHRSRRGHALRSRIPVAVLRHRPAKR